MGASLQTWGQVPCWHTGMFVNRQLFLAGRWCQAFSFLPGTVPQKNTPMPAFCAREIYCTMRQQSFQARFSAGLRGVRSGSQMCVERSLVPDQAKGSAWLLLCWPCKPLVWLWLSPWGDMGIGQAAIPNLFLYCVRGHAAGGGKSSLVSLCACAAVLFSEKCYLWSYESKPHGAGMEYVLAASDHCRAWGGVLTRTVKVIFPEEHGSPVHQLSLSPEPESIRDATRGVLREDNEGIWKCTKQSQSLFKVEKKTSN